MTTPGFNGAVRRTFQPMPLPPAPGQSSAQSNGGGTQRAQRAPQAVSTGASRQNRVRSAPSASDLLKPILYILIANVLLLAAVLACVTLILIPLGIIMGIQSFRFGWRGVQMLFGR